MFLERGYILPNNSMNLTKGRGLDLKSPHTKYNLMRKLNEVKEQNNSSEEEEEDKT